MSSWLVHHAGMPVLVVPQEAADANGPVLVAFDSSEAAAGAVAAAGVAAPRARRRGGARVAVAAILHAADRPVLVA